jgi:hypothetical protein
VPPKLFLVVALIDLLYQFWIHTEQVGRLGWFDRVFASPSNHRVHHAVNDRYVDRNYGGILIVWDRLFGTFADERDDDPPVYGTRSPLRSFNPLWANFEVYAQLARDSLRARRWVDKLQVWVRRPGWRPADVAAADPKPAFALARRERFDPPVTRAVRAYALVQFALLLGCTVHLLRMQAVSPTGEALAYFAYLMLGLVALGGLLEGRRVFLGLEMFRHALTFAGVLLSGGWFGIASLAPLAQAAIAAIAAASAMAAVWAGRGLSQDPIGSGARA